MDKLLEGLKKFMEIRKAREDLAKKQAAHKSEQAFHISSPKIMSAGTPPAAGPKMTVTATSSTGMGRGIRSGGGSNIRATTTWKNPLGKSGEKGVHTPFQSPVGAGKGQSKAGDEARWAQATDEAKMPRSKAGHSKKAKDEHKKVLGELKNMPKPNLPKTEKMEKKQKALIRPDVVSTPETYSEPGMVSRPATISGPTMMNVRKAGPNDGERANPIDMGDVVNETGLRLSEHEGAQKYHIYDGKMRITHKPMTLGEINAKHGPTQKIESSGLRVIPHHPQPLAPQKLRRSSSEE